jgi:class 3 adenylate cyclase/KaiC/GvpD/RAD55 family RecA-like ATPase
MASSKRLAIVTFVLTDIENSTRLLDEYGPSMEEAIGIHDAILAREIEGAGGIVVRSKGEGDSFFGVFELASAAVSAAVAIQSRLAETYWPTETPVRVRVGLYTGEAMVLGDDYAGIAIHRCARIRSLAKGGEVLLGSTTALLVRDRLPRDLYLIDRGEKSLRGLKAPERIFQLAYPTSGAPNTAKMSDTRTAPFIDAVTELLESLASVASPSDLPRLTQLLHALAKISHPHAAPPNKTDIPEPVTHTDAGERPEVSLSTGFVDLDTAIGGLGRGWLVLVAGHPGVGKTSFALNVALHSSIEQRLPVAILSLEAPKESLTERLVAIQALVDITRLHRGVLTEAEFDRISNALGPLGEAPMYIDDSPSLDLAGFAERVKRAVSDQGVRMVIVDYPALMHIPGAFLSGGAEFEETVSHTAKRLARETGTTIVLISQTDQTIRRVDTRPLLRDVGGHEHADCILILHLKDALHRQSSEIAEVIVAKNRGGPTGTIELLFRPATGRFLNAQRGRT